MLRDGSLLILAKTQKIADKFIKTTNFGGLCPVSISYHATLNSYQGTIYDRNLINVCEEEILTDLNDQGVLKIH